MPSFMACLRTCCFSGNGKAKTKSAMLALLLFQYGFFLFWEQLIFCLFGTKEELLQHLPSDIISIISYIQIFFTYNHYDHKGSEGKLEEFVGFCIRCGKPIYCLNGFLNGAIDEKNGSLFCFSCLEENENADFTHQFIESANKCRLDCDD